MQSSTASSCNTNSATTHPSYNTIRVLQYNGSTTNLPIAIQFPFSCNTIFCHCTSYTAIQSPITIQFSFSCNTMPSNYTPRLQYNFFLLQYNPKPTTPFSCNTIAIQFFQPSIAIQLQGCNTNFFFHNTIWAIAHPNFCCIIFFHFFSLFFFFTLISSYWRQKCT